MRIIIKRDRERERERERGENKPLLQRGFALWRMSSFVGMVFCLVAMNRYLEGGYFHAKSNTHCVPAHHSRSTRYDTTPQHHHNTMPTHNHYQLIYCREQERNGEERRGMERNGEEWNGVEWSGTCRYVSSLLFLLSSLFPPLLFYSKYIKTKREGEVYLDSPPFSKFFSIFLIKSSSLHNYLFLKTKVEEMNGTTQKSVCHCLNITR
jgi:hypothetical protein